MPAGGAVVCGLCAYTLSIIYAIICLVKKHNISFKEILTRLKDFLLPWLIFGITLFFTAKIMPMNLTSRMIQIPVLAFSGIICFGVYFIVSLQTGILTNLLKELNLKIPFLKNKK